MNTAIRTTIFILLLGFLLEAGLMLYSSGKIGLCHPVVKQTEELRKMPPPEDPQVLQEKANELLKSPYVSRVILTRGNRVLFDREKHPEEVSTSVVIKKGDYTITIFAPISVCVRRAIVWLLGSCFILTAIAVYIFLHFSVVRRFREISAYIREIEEGLEELNALMEHVDLLEAKEILASVGELLSRVRERLESRIYEQRLEKMQIHNSVVDIIDGVDRVLEGDLTVRLPVSSSLTGALAEALNSLIAKFEGTLSKMDGILERLEKDDLYREEARKLKEELQQFRFRKGLKP